MHSTRRTVDFLRGPIFKSLILFALPILVSNIFQQFYNLADTMIVANYLGDEALAAIGACTAIYDLLIGFALGIGTGLSVVTARSYGAGDQDLLKRSVACSLVIGAAISVVITLLGVFLLEPLLRVLNTPAEIMDMSYQYISTIIWFTLAMFSYNLFSGLLRAVGNSVMPLVFLIFSSFLNIGLDILFITTLSMGITGAAVATGLSQAISAVLCAVYSWKKASLLLPGREHFRLDRTLFRELLGQGLSMGFMSSIVSLGTVVLQYGINSLGTLVIAGHTTARKIFAFFAMPFGAMAQAIATFVSQNRGACRRDRIRKALRYAALYQIAAAAVITVILLAWAPAIVHLVSGSEEAVVLENGSLYLRVLGPFLAVLGVLLQSRNALQGLGEKLIPLVSSVIEMVMKVLFVALLIPRFGYLAVVFCEPVIWCVMTVQLLWSLHRNKFMRGQ